MPRLFPLILAGWIAAAPAAAQLLQVQPLPAAETSSAEATSGAHGHLPYADVGRAALVDAPAGFALGQPCRVQPAVAAALAQLLAAQAASGVAGALRGVSCYRSIAHQRSVYCRGSRGCAATDRARLVAPPGFSEHETGYAIDFAARPQPGCADVAPCFGGTPAGQWLLANGPRFGFETSFPPNNAQGVTWEPWHWRWVGTDGEDPAAADARRVFAAARARYPGQPAVPPLRVRVLAPPPPVALAPPTPAPPPPAPPRHRGLFGRR